MNQSLCLLKRSLILSSIIQLLSGHATSGDEIAETSINLSLGNSHSCVVFNNNNNKMKCWGNGVGIGYDMNENIGDSITDLGDNLPYFDPGNNLKIRKVSCGGQHTCILISNNRIKCFGFNYYGQVGIGSSLNIIGTVSNHIGDDLPFVNLGENIEVYDITLGYYHTCAIVSRNKVKCFGFGLYGQLGYESSSSIGRELSKMGDKLSSVDLGTDYQVKSIHSSASASHTCAIFLKPDSYSSRIKCWGSGYFYQLGYGNRSDKGNNENQMGNHLSFIDLGEESRVFQIAVGGSHTCALLIDSSLKCWGLGTYGQLGSGSESTIKSTGKSLPSVIIDEGERISMISSGFHFSCILYKGNQQLKCFGRNSFGQLGQGDKFNRGNSPLSIINKITPIDLGVGDLEIVTIQSGGSFNCVGFSDSSIKCFGDGAYGQLGIGSSNPVGAKPHEMGNNLQFAYLFSTKSPTTPSKSPSQKPTHRPSKEPTEKPTNKPTVPTLSPTKPTAHPTHLPSTKKPTTTHSPTSDNQIQFS